jgi:hypothetical protein
VRASAACAPLPLLPHVFPGDMGPRLAESFLFPEKQARFHRCAPGTFRVILFCEEGTRSPSATWTRWNLNRRDTDPTSARRRGHIVAPEK